MNKVDSGDTPILVGDGSFVIDPHHESWWDESTDGTILHAKKAASSITSVQLLKIVETDNQTTYEREGEMLCSANDTTKPKCDKVLVSYSYNGEGSPAVLRVQQNGNKVMMRWAHRNHSFRFDFDVDPSSPAGNPKYVCTDRPQEKPPSGCPEGKISLLTVNGKDTQIGAGKHRVEIVLHNVKP